MADTENNNNTNDNGNKNSDNINTNNNINSNINANSNTEGNNNSNTSTNDENDKNGAEEEKIDDSKDTNVNISLNKEDLTPAQLAEMAIESLFKEAQHDFVDIITPSKKVTLEKDSYEGVSANVDHANLLVFKFEDKTTVIISQEFVVEGYDSE